MQHSEAIMLPLQPIFFTGMLLVLCYIYIVLSYYACILHFHVACYTEVRPGL